MFRSESLRAVSHRRTDLKVLAFFCRGRRRFTSWHYTPRKKSGNEHLKPLRKRVRSLERSKPTLNYPHARHWVYTSVKDARGSYAQCTDGTCVSHVDGEPAGKWVGTEEREREKKGSELTSWAGPQPCPGIFSPIFLYWCLLAPSFSTGVSSPHHSLLMSPLPIILSWCLLSPSFSTGVSSPHHSLLVSPSPIILYWCLLAPSFSTGVSSPHHSLLMSPLPIILSWSPSFSRGVSSPHHSLLMSPLPIILSWCLLSPSFSTGVSSPPSFSTGVSSLHHSLLVSPLPIIISWCLLSPSFSTGVS